MSSEENKAIVRRFLEEVRNQKNVEVMHEILPPTWIAHVPGRDIHAELERFRNADRVYYETTPDLHDEIIDMVAEGDKVAVFHIRTATLKKEFGELPATGEKLSMWMMQIFRIEDAKIAETWTVRDSVEFEEFLGTYSKRF